MIHLEQIHGGVLWPSLFLILWPISPLIFGSCRPYIFDRGENEFEKYFFRRKEQCSWLQCFLFSFCSCSQFQNFFIFLFCSCSRTRTSSRTCSRTTCVFFHPCSQNFKFLDVTLKCLWYPLELFIYRSYHWSRFISERKIDLTHLSYITYVKKKMKRSESFIVVLIQRKAFL